MRLNKVDKENILVIGIDLGGTNVRVGVVDLYGRVSHRLMLPTMVNLGLQEVVERIIRMIQQTIGQVIDSGRQVKAVGIGAPGVIDIKTGSVVSSPNFPEWKRVPLRQIIEDKVFIPTFLDNDANAFAFGEKWVGAGREAESLVCLTLGTGVGGGIILDGRLWHGADGMAAEIGHITIVPDGLECKCGNRGCLESYASASSIVRRIIIAVKSGRKTQAINYADGQIEKLTSDMVYQAALQGDRLAIEIMEETATFLGIGIANLINLLNPDMIILGGGLTNAWDLIYPITLREVKQRAFFVPAQRVRIIRAALQDNAGIIGSAGIAYFNLDPCLVKNP